MALMPVEQAKTRILAGVEPLPAESVSIYEARGRVLAQDLKATLTQPPFDASAMDGYAVRAQDVATVPALLKVIGTSAAGHAFAGKLGPEQAVRIFTGAPVPEGTGAIVIQEDTSPVPPDGVSILQSAAPGRHIRKRGYDFEEGVPSLQAGTRLNGRHLMLAAATNHPTLPVRRKPIVAILANGDELVPPGETPKASQIVSSIPAALIPAIETWGGHALLLAIAKDTKESIGAEIDAAARADVLVTIGGASVGDHDLVRGALEEKGARFEVLKAAIRPGKPVMFGTLGPQKVLNLPGNPASAMICSAIFLKPLIAALLGLPTDEAVHEIPLARAVGANGERAHYMRANASGGTVAPDPDQDSSLISVLARSNCLLVRPVNSPALPAGTPVPVIFLDF
jgi:molybdopterin molybdotransferase